MNSRMLAVALVAMVIPLCTFARIGETLAQCDARYGNGGGMVLDEYSTFKKDGLAVLAHFYQGRVDYITYTKEAGVLLGFEIEKLLEANGGNRKWENRGPSPDCRLWATTDNALTAFLAVEGNSLSISTKEFEERLAAQRRADAKKYLEERKKSLEGF